MRAASSRRAATSADAGRTGCGGTTSTTNDALRHVDRHDGGYDVARRRGRAPLRQHDSAGAVVKKLVCAYSSSPSCARIAASTSGCWCPRQDTAGRHGIALVELPMDDVAHASPPLGKPQSANEK